MAKKRIHRLLNIEPGEELPVGFLMSFSFFMGIALAFYFTAVISMFMQEKPFQGKPEFLIYTYLVSGFLFFVLWLVWSRLEKRLSFSRLFTIGLALILVSVAVLTFLRVGIGGPVEAGIDGQYFSAGLSFFMLIWVAVFIYVGAVGFWGMASQMFNLRQGKRLFGLIGTGAVVSDIIGFFSIPVILKLDVLSTSGLLYVSVGGLAVCLLLMLVFGSRFKGQLGKKPEPVIAVKKAKKTPLYSNRYQLLIIIMAALPMVGLYVIDFMFMEATSRSYGTSPETMANFIGLLLGSIAIVELLVKTLLYGRLMNQYGLRFGLLALPIALVLSTLLTIVAGFIVLSQEAEDPTRDPTFLAILLAVICLGKLFERVMRSGVHDPSFRVLYQPIPDRIRMAFQSKVEGVPSAIGNLVAGGILLAFTFLGFKDAAWIGIFFLLVLVYWIRIAMQLHRSYKGALQETLQKKTNLEPEVRSMAVNGVDVLRDGLSSLNLAERKASLTLLHEGSPIAVSKHADDLLQSSEDGLTRLTNLNLNYTDGKEGYDSVEKEEKPPPDLLWKETFKAKSIEEAQKWLTDDEWTELYWQIDLPFLVISDPVNQFSPGLKDLLQELNSNSREFTRKADLLELLHTPYSHVAMDMLVDYGDDVLPELQAAFTKTHSSKVQRKIVALHARIGTKSAIRKLEDHLNYPGREVQQHALAGLRSLGYSAPKERRQAIKTKVEEVVGSMIWLLAGRTDLEIKYLNSTLYQALEKEYEDYFALLFDFLRFLYLPTSIDLIEESLSTESEGQRHIFALELIDNFIEDDIKRIILPLCEDLPIAARIKRLENEFPQQVLSPKARLIEIVNRDYASTSLWLKALAISELGRLSLPRIPNAIKAAFFHPKLLISEAAAEILISQDQALYKECLQQVSAERKQHFQQVFREGSSPLPLYRKMELLSEVPPFRSLPRASLHLVAAVFKQRIIRQRAVIYGRDGSQSKVNLLIDGGATFYCDGGISPDLINARCVLEGQGLRNEVGYIVAEPGSILLQADRAEFFDVLFDDPQVTEGLLEAVGHLVV